MRWKIGHPVWRLLGALFAFLFIALPAFISSWWFLFSSTPPYQWFRERGWTVSISPLWIPVMIGLLLFGVVLWSIWRERQSDKRTTVSHIPVECGPNVKGSVVKANGFTFYRARIEPSGNQQFPNLIAKVHGIKRDEVEMHLDEVLQIKYYPGDGSAPCARKDDPAFLDVVFVSPEAVPNLHVLFWPPGIKNWNFESGHNYQLDVAILSDEISRRCEFEFVWTGDTNTSSCRLITDGTKQHSERPAVPLPSLIPDKAEPPPSLTL